MKRFYSKTNLSCDLVFALLLLFTNVGYSQSKIMLSDNVTEGYVNIGSHKLFVNFKRIANCKYTIVFESGGGGNSKEWAKVRSLLPISIQTLAYDRAGLGKSEEGPLPRTIAQEVFELHQLLTEFKINGPLILVGQSVGGLNIRLYTEKYGKNVAGLVLVDPTDENSQLGSIKYGGWVRLREKAVGKIVPKPQLKLKVSPGYDSTVDYFAEELQQIFLSRLKNPQSLKSRPLIVLGAGKREKPPGTSNDQWDAIRTERDKQIRELTNLSANSKFILAPQSSHSIHQDDPEIVANATEMIINSINSKRNLGDLK